MPTLISQLFWWPVTIQWAIWRHTLDYLEQKNSLHKVYSFTRQYEVNICGVGPHRQIHGSLPFSPAGSVGRFGTWDWESHHALGHLQVTWWFQRKIHNIFGFNHMAYHQTRDFAAMFLPTSNLIQKPPQTGRFRAPLVELHGGFADVWPGWAQGAGFAGTCHCERPSDPEKLGSWLESWLLWIEMEWTNGWKVKIEIEGLRLNIEPAELATMVFLYSYLYSHSLYLSLSPSLVLSFPLSFYLQIKNWKSTCIWDGS